MSSPPSSSTDPGPEAGSEPTQTPDVPPKRGSVLSVVLTLGLLALLVWGMSPRRIRLKPAPLDPVTASCAPSKGDFVPSNLTELPGAPLADLPDAVKNRVLLRLNMEPCTCGCALSLASCRAGNPQCQVSPHAIDTAAKEAQGDAPPPHTRQPASAR
jgi:hypothetical protein